MRTGEIMAKSSKPPGDHGELFRSVFQVPGMDCPSEEGIVRMALEGQEGVLDVAIDLSRRKVAVVHQGSCQPILERLALLGMGAELESSGEVSDELSEEHTAMRDGQAEGCVLRLLLAINATMFVFEMLVGWFADSTGLIADSLDMFADAAVYGLSLYAVGRTASLKLRAAHFSGWLQLVLAFGALTEVARRFLFGSEPNPPFMISVSFLALAANVTSLLLIFRHRSGAAHMRASWIFSTNDVLANLGVIAAGLLVAWTGSRIPDLVIGSLIGGVVLIGAFRILRLRLDA